MPSKRFEVPSSDNKLDKMLSAANGVMTAGCNNRQKDEIFRKRQRGGR